MEPSVFNLIAKQRTILLQQLAEIEKVMGKADRADYQIHKRKLKNGFVYYAQYYGEDGKRLKTKFSLETADENIAHSRAREQKDKFLKRHFSGEKTGGAFYALLSGYYADGSKLLAEALDTNRDLRPEQIKRYKGFIDTYFIPFLKAGGIKKIEDFKIHHIRQFQAYLKKDMKPQTINTCINGSIKKIYDHLLLNGTIKETPFPENTSINLKVKEGDVRKRNIYAISRVFLILLDNRMWQMFVSESDFHNGNPKKGYEKKHLLCLIAATTGLRVGEIHFLRKSSIVKKAGVYFLKVENARIDESGLKTESSRRMVPLHPETYRAIMEYIRDNNITDYLFYKDQKTINYDIYKRANIECGIHCGYTQTEIGERNVVFHSFRHFYKTVLTNGGLPKEIASVFMGHAKNKRDMADNYSHIEDIGDDGADAELIAENGKQVIQILDRHFNDATFRLMGESNTIGFACDFREIEIESKEKNEEKKNGKVKKTYTFLACIILGYEEFIEVEYDGEYEE